MSSHVSELIAIEQIEITQLLLSILKTIVTDEIYLEASGSHKKGKLRSAADSGSANLNVFNTFSGFKRSATQPGFHKVCSCDIRVLPKGHIKIQLIKVTGEPLEQEM